MRLITSRRAFHPNRQQVFMAEHGRRAGMRVQWPKGRAGSIPVRDILDNASHLMYNKCYVVTSNSIIASLRISWWLYFHSFTILGTSNSSHSSFGRSLQRQGILVSLIRWRLSVASSKQTVISSFSSVGRALG